MNKLICITLVTFLIVLACNAHEDRPRFIQVDNNKYCGRKLKVNTSNGGYAMSVESRLNCKKQDGKAQQLRFDMNSRGLPNFAMRSFMKTSDSVENYMAKFGFDTVLEYEEKNNVAGYQPGVDTVVNSYRLRDNKIGNNGGEWSKITCDGSEDSGFLCSMSLQTNNVSAPLDSMTLQVLITPTEVEIQRNGTNVTRKILTPNSYKLNVEMDGLRYSSANTRMAIGTFFVYKGSSSKRSGEDEKEEERPDDSTATQDVLEVTSDASAMGFFSWDKYVNASVAGTYEIKTLHSSSVANAGNINDVEVDKGWTVVRVWFSPDTQVESLEWDPSIGVTEEPLSGETSAASATTLGLMLYIVMAIVLLL